MVVVVVVEDVHVLEEQGEVEMVERVLPFLLEEVVVVA